MDADFDNRFSVQNEEGNRFGFVVTSVEIDQEQLADSGNSEESASPTSRSVTSDEQIYFEPLFADPYELSYTCLMIPRFSSHYLMGDLSDNLRSWMLNICISFGWKLDFLIVKSDYLEWAIHIPPTTSPAYCIQMVRQHLSSNIFSEHPRFKKENVSGDFWATGHIILVGSRPLPDDIIQRFIQTTRRQQV